ncbi:hypothetical protein DAPPUDRAFT_247460 [Daphnia pulex]|uniref:Uncharacterized protein n=1 Tax=Daphnia pulex TaxID=6669 RepID=E9GSG4_DAPPU|nr:hypothetical protein DAPPUDRAFT_247460 [Daphnia pulex]|eukprot:EFX77422.1 hypothetical protein DAPPUDRAFT_247460 [Daphnia pulex]
MKSTLFMMHTTVHLPNYGVVLQLCLATPPTPYYTTYDTTSCYTEAPKHCTKAPDYYAPTDAALSYNTESPYYTTKGSITTPMLRSTTLYIMERKGERIQQPSEHLHYSNRNCRAPFVINLILRRIKVLNKVNHGVVLLLGVIWMMAGTTTAYYTEAPKCYTIKAPEYYTTTCAAPMLLRRSSELHYLHHAECYTTKAAECYTTKAAKCYTTKAAECYTTKAAECYTTKAAECYTIPYVTTTYYTEAPKALLCPELLHQ